MKCEVSSLYIHIPFCARKCAYCDFVSFEAKPSLRAEYLNLLHKELGMMGQRYGIPELETIFIGGGTPSLLCPDEILALGRSIDEAYGRQEDMEFSIEANPGTLTAESLEAWKSVGVNRVSMGVQSMDDKMLKRIGRIHTADEVRSSFKLLRSSGFDNINLDIMFGLPGQTAAELLDTIAQVVALEPEHISAYSLKVEEGTPFDLLAESGKLSLPTEEEDRAMYHALIESLSKAGYEQYEISNFSKLGKRCRHNMVYWKGEAYLAAGMAAHGYIEGRRYGNHADFDSYREDLERNDLPIDTVEIIDKDEAAFEFIMLGLRLNDGVDMEAYDRKFKENFREKYRAVIEKQLSQGSIEEKENHIRLTSYGRDIANVVIAEFMAD